MHEYIIYVLPDPLQVGGKKINLYSTTAVQVLVEHSGIEPLTSTLPV